MDKSLDAVSFADAAKAEEMLAALSADHPQLMDSLSEALARTAEPDALLVRLERFLDAGLSRQSQLSLMAASPDYLLLVAALLAEGPFLTDILCRNPEYAPWMWEQVDLQAKPGRDALCAELLRQVHALEGFEEQCQSMRRFKRREILRIAARDVYAHAPLSSVAEDLSDLADAALEAALACAAVDLEPRYGRPVQLEGALPGSFCILALGKHGGRELNFSSDIDLIFLRGGEGETSGGTAGPVSFEDYFQRLGERIIKAMSQITSEGQVFRVDMRLRPYGEGAPLVAPIDAALSYYESVGRAWERQALIKARPVAGNIELGELFLERTRPFVYPRYFDDETLEDIGGVKAQLEARVADEGKTDREVKLGRGGIRDVEFTVQMLQLLNGGRLPGLRTPNTLEAISALGQQGFLRPLDADALAHNYVFLRRVEHRLQIAGSQQVHALPDKEPDLHALAVRLGYRSGGSFIEDYRGRTGENRRILEQFMASEARGTRWVYDLLHPQHGGEAGLAKLRTLGFAGAAKAREELMQLYAGPPERPNALRVRQTFTAVLPRLLEQTAACTDPDAVLMRLGRVLSKLWAPAALYDLLVYNERLVDYLVRLVDNSTFLAGLLVSDPGLFDALGAAGALDQPSSREAFEEVLASLLRAQDREAAIYRFHGGEMLRIGMRDLFLDPGVAAVGRELTLLAEVCLAHVLEGALARTARRYGAADGGFAVVGMGKLGGRELGYGSDLDLLFVYDEDAATEMGMAQSEYYANAAANVINALKERTRHGVLYDVDARLRPDGGKGVLAVSTRRLEEYYRGDAQPWERLALLKARCVAGPADFQARLGAQLKTLAYDQPFPPEGAANVTDMRRRIAAEAGPLDLKKAPGGIIEIEFAVRLLQLRHGGEESVRHAGVCDVLPGLVALGALSPADAAALEEAYLTLRRIENRIRMARGASGSSLPEDGAAQDDLARRLGLTEGLVECVQRHRDAVRRVYGRVLDSYGLIP